MLCVVSLILPCISLYSPVCVRLSCVVMSFQHYLMVLPCLFIYYVSFHACSSSMFLFYATNHVLSCMYICIASSLMYCICLVILSREVGRSASPS